MNPDTIKKLKALELACESVWEEKGMSGLDAFYGKIVRSDVSLLMSKKEFVDAVEKAQLDITCDRAFLAEENTKPKGTPLSTLQDFEMKVAAITSIVKSNNLN